MTSSTTQVLADIYVTIIFPEKGDMETGRGSATPIFRQFLGSIRGEKEMVEIFSEITASIRIM